MAPRKPIPKRTTQLPASLRTELESLGHINKSKRDRKRQDAQGKGKGKAREEESQRNRAAHFAEKKRKAEGDLQHGEQEEEELREGSSSSSKRARVDPPKHQTPLEKLLLKQERKQSNGVSSEQKMTKVESTEDQEIAWLEAKLKMEKGGEDDDGLEDLFAGVDDLERAAFGPETKDYSKLDLDLDFDGLDSDDSDDSDELDDSDLEAAEYGVSEEELIDPSDDDDHREMGEIGSHDSAEEEEAEVGVDLGAEDEEEEEWGGVQMEDEDEESDGDVDEDDEEEEVEVDSEVEGKEMEARWGMEEGDEEDESGNMVWTFDNEGNATATPAEKTKDRKGVRFEDSLPSATESISTTTKRYVPPHLRNPAPAAPALTSAPAPASATPAKEPPLDPRLRRVLLSHLNKLSSSNISNILSSLVALYSSHPRAVLSSALSTLLLELISVKDTLGESFLVVYAALVAALGKEMGIEVGAGVIGKAVKGFDESRELVKASRSVQRSVGEFEGKPGRKEAENIVGFLSELYNFGVVGCEIVYGLIREFINVEGEEKGMQELEVELLVRVIKRCGQQLRTDDPTALKEIVNLVKQKMQGVDPASINSRTKFMIENLTNLKNNKIRQLGSSADGSVDHYTPLKKFLSGLRKAAPDPLHLTLADIRTSSSKGKWWIVGAVWSGDPLLDPKNQKLLSSIGGSVGERGDDTLNQLAKKQGMNTDVRKSVFTVLMSSEDYVDACERLLQLGLTDVQQREIARVLLQCCGNEKVYNPYYTLLAQRLSQKSHSFQITLQYLLWDFLRDLGEKKVGGEEMVKSLEEGGRGAGGGVEGKKVSKRKRDNVAKLFGWCVGKEALSLMILKPLNFTSLQPLTTSFLQTLLSSMILSTQTTSPTLSLSAASSTRREKEIFERVLVRVAAHEGLLRGLAYFFEVGFDEDEGESAMGWGEQEMKVVRWGVKVAKGTLSFGGSLVDVR